MINHGIPEELLERVKKVASEFYKLEREENFKNSTSVKLLSDSVEKKSSEMEHVDWEDVITLLDDNEWPEKTPGFRYIIKQFILKESQTITKALSQLVKKKVRHHIKK